MQPNEPTTIIAQWLAAHPETVPHLRETDAAGGTTGLHDEVKTYFQEHDTGNPAVEQLARWGIAHDPPDPTRYRMLTWVFNQIDWEYVADRLREETPRHPPGLAPPPS